MNTHAIHPARIRKLNAAEPSRRAGYVLYWMQQSQRAELNHALEFAVQRANALGRPLLVGFGLYDRYPEANVRHMTFMLEGLSETARALQERGIMLAVRAGRPDDVALELGRGAAAVVADRGYLRHQKVWRKRLAAALEVPLYEVESDVIVPVEVASDKAEFAAYTIRPKIARQRAEHAVELLPTPLDHPSLELDVGGLDLSRAEDILARLHIDRSVAPVSALFRGGSREARRVLARFLAEQLDGYAAARNQPQEGAVSHMSKYLHFGQISPIEVALRVAEARYAPERDRETYLEELLVRRELAHNFVHFSENYDSYAALPSWARETLQAHRADPRRQVYSREELEHAQTHDPYWNAAMDEMRFTGYMHNYMRMYWGKKILEWSESPEDAYATTLGLNNKYFLDGRDPSSYANVGWIFGLHDRPWAEREVFGKVRYMNAAGLRRKCDIEAYVETVRTRIEALRGPSS